MLVATVTYPDSNIYIHWESDFQHEKGLKLDFDDIKICVDLMEPQLSLFKTF